ncbi:hypothetical protein FH972_021447 [Carpinus fangiana]|uniref:Ras-GAP domain-containing protein n=1 Tax=Carpinus fangiana TaxID=176857 RepID=A0A5N6KPP7_9ROSI|nr:hypothetical protein FH972_021447 [Carpinus fangiana]
MAGLFSKARPRTSHVALADNDQLQRDSQTLTAAAAMTPADSRDMLNLMRTARGRAQGDLSFRQARLFNSPWKDSYCYINVESRSLRYETTSATGDGASEFETLIADLRACAVHAWYDTSSKRATLHLASADGAAELDLRPKNDSQFSRWFAALLCWHPLRRGQDLHSTVKTLLPAPLANPFAGEAQDRPLRQLTPDDENTILKRDKALLINADSSSSTTSRRSLDDKNIDVTCVIRGNGELSIHAFNGASVLATVTLDQVPRSAIQRLSKTVFDRDRVLAIYPQYVKVSEACSRLRPIYLAFPSRGLYEAWFVLLRSSAAPELYGSQKLKSSDPYTLSDGKSGAAGSRVAPLLRIEQSLDVRVTKAKFREAFDASEKQSGAAARRFLLPASYYAEILLDEHVKARTVVRSDLRGNLFWNEIHSFQDLPSLLRSLTVRIKKLDHTALDNVDQNSSNKGHRENGGRRDQSPLPLTDEVCGEVVIDMNELQTTKEGDKTWHMTDVYGSRVGELTMSIEHRKQDILMEHEYHQMFDYLQDFSNSMTLKICNHIPSQLPRLADGFLNVFQTADRAGEWLQSLVEAEIFDKHPRRPVAEEAVPGAPTTPRNDSQAFILFRGTSLLSKAFDTYMKRCGECYLEETIGERMREIKAADIDCEVDPSKLPSTGDILTNWQQLVSVTKSVWTLIYKSASRCPKELRLIFRHIRNCAQQRYGDETRSVIYTSVSGFLFLRFFCAAILSPRTFGLIKGEPTERTKRTFTLVAKSLQGLANKTTFGKKESWMAPMDDFCSKYRDQFEEYIDIVCARAQDDHANLSSNEDIISPASTTASPSSKQSKPANGKIEVSQLEPHLEDLSFSYTTGPLAAMTRRLAPIAREGYLSLPFLIDPARNLAALVDVWLDHVDAGGKPTESVLIGMDSDLSRFHRLCLRLRQKTQAHAEHIDQAADPDGGTAGIAQQKWVIIAELIEAKPAWFWRQPLVDTLDTKQATNGRSFLPIRPGSAPQRPASASQAKTSEKGKQRANTISKTQGKEEGGSRRSSMLDVSSKPAITPQTSNADMARIGRPSSRTSARSNGATSKVMTSGKANGKKKSPPRKAEDNAMRKLGWI